MPSCPLGCSSLSDDNNNDTSGGPELWIHFVTHHKLILPCSPDTCNDIEGFLKVVAEKTNSTNSNSETFISINFDKFPELTKFFTKESIAEYEQHLAEAMKEEEGVDINKKKNVSTKKENVASAAAASSSKTEEKINDEDDDDDEEEEGEGEEIQIPASCLYCGEVSSSPLEHLRLKHNNFDLKKSFCTEFGQKEPNFFPPSIHHRIAIINHIRKCMMEKKCPYGCDCDCKEEENNNISEEHFLKNSRHRLPKEVPDLESDDSSSLLVPVVKNDGMIMLVVSMFPEFDDDE